MLKGHKIREGKGIQSSIVIDSNVILDTFDPRSARNGRCLNTENQTRQQAMKSRNSSTGAALLAIPEV